MAHSRALKLGDYQRDASVAPGCGDAQADLWPHLQRNAYHLREGEGLLGHLLAGRREAAESKSRLDRSGKCGNSWKFHSDAALTPV